jgi:predicted phage terminase large subunit-like protein
MTISDIDFVEQLRDIKDFHYFVLEHCLSTQSHKAPTFHWELYDTFNLAKRLILAVAPVGFAKSTILKIWGAYQVLYNFESYTLYVSSTSTKSIIQFGTLLKIFKTKAMQTFFKFKIIKDNESEIIIQRENGFKQKIEAIASGSDISGINFESARPSLILIDDLEELDQAKNKARTDKLQEWVFTTLISRLPSLTEGRVRMINTVLTLDSLTNRILGKAPNKESYINLVSDWFTIIYQALRDGVSIWEAKHPTKALLDEKIKDPVTFARNYMNDPIDTSNALVKEEMLRYYQTVNLDDFDNLYMHADTTHTGKTTSDYFSLVVLGENKKDKNYYIIDFILEQLDVEKQARSTIVMYSKYLSKVKKLTYDEKANNGFGYWVKKLAKEEYGISLPIEELKYPSDKISHFTPHLPHFIANRVYFPSLHKDINTAISQLTAFPSDNIHDDFVDGLSGVLDNFTQAKKTGGFAFVST